MTMANVSGHFYLSMKPVCIRVIHQWGLTSIFYVYFVGQCSSYGFRKYNAQVKSQDMLGAYAEFMKLVA